MANGLFSPKQASFRKNYWIQDPTIDLINFIHCSFNQRSYDLSIYIDSAKAFNIVDISILLHKLKSFDFDENELALGGTRFGPWNIIIFDVHERLAECILYMHVCR